MSITFDAAGFQQYTEDGTVGWFDQRFGDQINLYSFDLVPDLPARLDSPRLWHDLAVQAAEVGCLIEARVIQLDGIPALHQIMKLPRPDQPTGQLFIAAFTIPRAECSVVLKIQAWEDGTTGIREAVLGNQFELDQWFLPHPYAPDLRGRLPFHAGDDPRFDPMFPDHPLSRVRAWSHRVAGTIRVDRRFAALPPFA